jgi:hypothetical protein
MGKSIYPFSPFAKENFRLFLRQQTDKRQTSLALKADGKQIQENRLGFCFQFETTAYKYKYIIILYIHIYTRIKLFAEINKLQVKRRLKS